MGDFFVGALNLDVRSAVGKVAGFLRVHSQKRASCSKSAITKPISGCVRIACSGLIITSLLQVVNRLGAS